MAGSRSAESSALTLARVTEEPERERAALVALLQASKTLKMSWSEVVAAVLEADSACAVLEQSLPATLLGDDELRAHLAVAADVIAGWGRAGERFVTVLDPGYPAQLREIQEAPPFVFYRGDLRPDDAAVSVVGSREAGTRGLEIAAGLAEHLVAADLTVVAGLAAGIDTVAHRHALDAGGRTVAVIGSGIRTAYPAANRELQETIAHEGLVLSQFYPDAPPRRHQFPRRNATMSGYGVATVVVEAGEHSGARIQARVAIEHGRPVILTDLVLERTDWAKALRDRPGVHVATSVSEVLEVVDSIRRDTATLLKATASLV